MTGQRLRGLRFANTPMRSPQHTPTELLCHSLVHALSQSLLELVVICYRNKGTLHAHAKWGILVGAVARASKGAPDAALWLRARLQRKCLVR